MFKMKYAQLFDAYLPRTDIPAFERLKTKGDNPEYNYEFIDFASSNINGVPLHCNGWTVLTPVYRVTLYCDACELPVHSFKMHGATREVHVDKYLELKQNEKLRTELEKLDRTVLGELKREVELNNFYKLQCARCGRWIAKGNQHEECFDETHGICKYCGNTLREILKVRSKNE